MLPMPPVEERTIGVNEARSISRIRSSLFKVFMFSIATGQCGSLIRGGIRIETFINSSPSIWVRNATSSLPCLKGWNSYL